MNLLKCPLIENDCCKAGAKLNPRGVMVHSTGANNPNLRRYVQPVEGQENYSGLVAALGRNTNGNHWNRPGVEKCVHAFIGRLADGGLATVQTLPWDIRGWHCGGQGNNTHLSFEICEDGLEDPAYFRAVYREAAELTAYLCKLYDLDPLADGVVICHAEGYRRGIASRHGDVENWFPKMGRTMDDFRRDAASLMSGTPAEEPEKGDDEEMTGEEIVKRINEYTSTLTLPGWAKEELEEAVELGITDGKDPMAYVPRYQAAIMAKRAVEAAMEKI